MQVPRLIGYTGVSLVFLALLAQLARGLAEPRAVDPAFLVLVLVLNGLAWALPRLMGSQASALGRSLTLLGDALFPLNLVSLLHLVAAGGGTAARLFVLASAGTAYLALGWLRTRTLSGDPLYPYFYAAWGGLLCFLLRHMLGLMPGPLLWTLLAFAVLLQLVSVPEDDLLRYHFGVAAALLLVTAVGLTCLAFGAKPTLDLLVALAGVSAVLVLWAVRSWEAGPEARIFGASAYLVVTLALTETLRFRDAPIPLYSVAMVTWIVILTIAGIVLVQPRAEPFRESAHWIAVLVACGLGMFTSPAWWTAAGLPSIPISPWGEVPPLLAAGSALVVGMALGVLAVHRRRSPPIAASLSGFAVNLGLSTFAAFLAPMLVISAATAVWGLASGFPATAPLVPLLFAIAILGLSRERERAYGPVALAFAGYGALLLAVFSTPGPGRRATAAMVACATILLWRSMRRSELLPHLAFLAAMTAIPLRSAGGGREVLAAAVLAVLALAAERLLLEHEGAGTRSLLPLGWAVLAGSWAVWASLERGPFVVVALLLVWLAIPLSLVGVDPRGRHYDRVVLIHDWLETAAHLLAIAAGATLMLLLWTGAGLRLRDSGPLLAIWALVHLGLYRRLEARLPRRPATVAAAVASWALSFVSLLLPFASTSRGVVAATLLLNATIAFAWAFPPVAFSRVLRWLGHALALLSAGVAAFGRPRLISEVLLAVGFVYLWRSFREGAVGAHFVFLGAAVASAVVAVAWHAVRDSVPVFSLLAVLLLVVQELARGLTGRRSSRAGLTLGTAMAAGLAAIGIDLWRGQLSQLAYLPLWIGFLASAARWEATPEEARSRPDEPEDRWLAAGSYWIGHWAGAGWLVTVLLASVLAPAWAPLVLAAWAWALLGLLAIAGSNRSGSGSVARSATGQAACLLALGAMAVAGHAWRLGQPAVLAALLAGMFFVSFGRGPAARLAAAVGFVEAYTLFGLSSGVRLAEYYCVGAAALLYVVLRLLGDNARLEPGEQWLLAGPGAWGRQLRASLVPLAILLLTAGYPLWVLVTRRQEIDLFFIGGAAALLPYGFWRAGQGSTYSTPLCVLYLAGALYLFAVSGLGAAASLFLLATGPLVMLNLLAFEERSEDSGAAGVAVGGPLDSRAS